MGPALAAIVSASIAGLVVGNIMKTAWKSRAVPLMNGTSNINNSRLEAAGE
jgi:hypothetical protein